MAKAIRPVIKNVLRHPRPLVAGPTIKPHFQSAQPTDRTFFLSYPIHRESLFTSLCFKSSSILHFADNRVINQHESLLSCLFTIFDIHNTQQKMDATTHSQPLADRPTNTHLANVNVNNDLKTDLKSADLSSMEQHRQMLQDKLDNGEK